MEFSQIIDSKNLCYLDTLFNAIMALSIVFGIITLVQTKRQNDFSSVKACNDMFRKIVRKQQEISFEDESQEVLEKHQIYLRDHLGLVYEELFYIRQRILPKRIALEWLSEMPLRLPVYDMENNLLNLELLQKGENRYLAKKHRDLIEDKMEYFEGVRSTFTIDKNFDFSYNNWKENKKQFSRYMYSKIRNNWCYRLRCIFSN